MNPDATRKPALDDAALGWAQRAVWALCVGIYLTVFIGGVSAGGAELMTLGRAIGFTVAAAVLGRIALGLLSRATLPIEEGRSATQAGPVGSRADLVSSANFAPHQDKAEAA